MKNEAEQPYIIIQQPSSRKKRGFIFEFESIIQQLEKQLQENHYDLLSSKCSSAEDLASKDFHTAMEIEEKKSEMPTTDDKNEKIIHQNNLGTHSDRSSRHKNKKNSKKMSKKNLGKINTAAKSVKEIKEENEMQVKKNKKVIYFLKKKEEIGLP